MTNKEIGETAGNVWRLLDEKESLTADQLKKELKGKKEDLYMALGWLYREDKLESCEKDGKVFFSLK